MLDLKITLEECLLALLDVLGLLSLALVLKPAPGTHPHLSG